MEIEVGMYVRDIFGKIGKLTDYNYEEEDAKNQWEYRERAFYKSSIKKASFNLIDLIEVGDIIYDDLRAEYTKIYRITEAEDNIDTMERCFNGNWNDMETIRPKHIKEILTHEQYEANCYKVVE